MDVQLVVSTASLDVQVISIHEGDNKGVLFVDLLTEMESPEHIANLVSRFSDEDEVQTQILNMLNSGRDSIFLAESFPPNFDNQPNSFIGGLPTLASHDDWPYDSEGRRAFFVAQLDCDEMNTVQSGVYPTTGVLYFFIGRDIEELHDNPNHCYVVHLPRTQGPAINDVPVDYVPDTGRTWLGAYCHEPNYTKIDQRLLQPRLWLKMPLRAIGYRSFESVYEYADSLFPQHRSNSEQNSDYERFCSIANELLESYTEQNSEALFGANPTSENVQFLTPGTLPSYTASHMAEQYTPVGNEYPWSRLHAALSANFLRDNAGRKIRLLVTKDASKELSRLLKLNINERYFLKREIKLKTETKVIYSGMKDQPEYLINDPQLSAWKKLLQPVKNPVIKLFSKAKDENLAIIFELLLEYEALHIEANEYVNKFADNPYNAPSSLERDEFNHWVSSWLNLGTLRRSRHQNVSDMLAGNDMPCRNSNLMLPNDHEIHEDTRFCVQFYAPHLQSQCNEANEMASLHCLWHSSESSSLIPEDVAKKYLKNLTSTIRRFKNCSLGYGENIQSSAHANRERVMLLQVSGFRPMMQIGDGALQFWIDKEELSKGRFDKAMVTADGT